MKHAFSLVELSIVLVILGLLTGGILAGQSLIRAAQLRGVTTEFQRYQAGVQTFRDKYFALPGDMTNATSFWGSMTNCAAASPSGTGTQTCNGNGDSVMNTSAVSRTSEIFGFWQHLSNAGLIEGRFTGINGPASQADATIGTNVPASKLPNAGWTTQNFGTITSVGVYFDLTYNNIFTFGAKFPSFETAGAIIKPEEAWNIDIKMDDGKPTSGKIVTPRAAIVGACTVNGSGGMPANSADNAAYRLTNSNADCSLIFVQAF